MIIYLGVALSLATFACSAALTWSVRELALRTNRLDMPNERSAHVRPTPRLGGVALMSTFLASATAACVVIGEWNAAPVLGATAVISALGFVDDLHPLSARTRLAVQILAAVFVLWARHHTVGAALGFAQAWPRWITLPAATLWIVWMTNLYNFMDGIDGLAGGQAVIGGSALALVAHSAGQPAVAMLALVCAAASLGFVRFNYPPASIFMGDAGSTALGFFFACVPFISARSGVTIDVIAFAFSLFILDATTTLIRRLVRGEHLSQAHRTHLYQRPLAHGIRHRPITLTAYVGMIVVASLAVWAARLPRSARIVPGIFAILLFVGLLHAARRLERGLSGRVATTSASE